MVPGQGTYLGQLRVKHFFSTVDGNFNDYQGEFLFDPNNLEASSFTFTIPVASIDTNNEKRDTHLRSEDFFLLKNIQTYYLNLRDSKKSGTKYVVHGDLTIRGIKQKVSVPFEITGEMDHPMMKDTRLMGLSFHTKLDRTDYKVGVGIGLPHWWLGIRLMSQSLWNSIPKIKRM